MVKEITWKNKEGKENSIELFGATSYIPENYLKIGKAGWLAN